MQIDDTGATRADARAGDAAESLRRLEENYDLDADLERVCEGMPAEHAEVARAAADVRTPPALLARAARFCAAEVAGNAALRGLLDAGAEWALSLPGEAAWALLEAAGPALAAPLLRALARHDDGKVRYRVAEEEQTPVAQLVALGRDRYPHIAEMARNTLRGVEAAHGAVPLDALLTLGGGDAEERWLRARLVARAADDGADPAELARLATHGDQEVRRALAGNPAAPPALLARLLEDEELSVRVEAEDNAATPREALELMERAQFGPELPPEALPRLLAGGPYARLLAGRQPWLSAEALTALWRGGDRFVREGVAENRNVPEALLPELARDAEAAVRAAIAGDLRLPAALLRALHDDGDLEVRRASVTNPTLPAELLAAAASDADRWLRARAAANPSTPPARLVALAGDAERLVRGMLLRNPALPEEALRALCGDADAELSQKAKATRAAERRKSQA